MFSRRRRRRGESEREATPQWTTSDRQVLTLPGGSPHALSYETYDAMQGDSMIQTALTIKRLGVLAAPTRIVAPDSADGVARVTLAERALANLEGSLEQVLSHAMDAFAKGWSVQEIVWSREGDVWLPAALRPKNPAHFGLDVTEYGRVRALYVHLPGEPSRRVPAEKFALYFHRATYARPKGRSDLDAAHRHWLAKQSLLAAWRLHLERFASPTILGKYRRGLPTQEQADMLAALQNLHQTSAIVFPEEIDLDTLGGSREPSSNFQMAIDYHNAEIARSILGQTLTTDEGRRVGSFALGRVHLDVLLLQLEALRRDLAETVVTRQILRRTMDLNFGPGPCPRFEFLPSRRVRFGD